MKLPSLRAALAAALASLVAPSVEAQCPQPDWLDDVGECVFASPSLPAFPAVQTLSVGICWSDCAVESQNPVLAKWGQLRPAQTAVIPPLCTVYIARLDLADPVTGVNEWGGPIRCFYSRTWVENDSLGRQIQVWRFLTNGDLRPTAAAGPTPCPVPPCAAAFTNRVHFSGHLDVAVQCSTGQRSIAWSLNHECDWWSHSADGRRAGTFHPGRSYTFVGPSASFVAGGIVGSEPTGVTSTVDATRQLMLLRLRERPPSPDICLAEQNIDSVVFQPESPEGCPCSTPGSYVSMSVNLNPFQVGELRVSPGGSFFTSRPIGRWVDPAVFPGLEGLRVNWGRYAMSSFCDLVPSEGDACYGVTTVGGFQAFALSFSGVGSALPLMFVDQGTSLDTSNFFPVIGTKYVTSAFLNLNF